MLNSILQNCYWISRRKILCKKIINTLNAIKFQSFGIFENNQVNNYVSKYLNISTRILCEKKKRDVISQIEEAIKREFEKIDQNMKKAPEKRTTNCREKDDREEKKSGGNDKDYEKDDEDARERSKNIWQVIIGLFILISLIAITYSTPSSFLYPKITWHQFEEEILKSHMLSGIHFMDETTALVFTKDFRKCLISFPSRAFFDAAFISSCQRLEIDPTFVNFSSESHKKRNFENNVILSIIITIFMVWIARRFIRNKIKIKTGGDDNPLNDLFPYMKKSYNQFNAAKSDVTFSDVRGCDEAKVEIREFVDFLKNPADFERLGAKLPKGAILHGPPGTGKTLMAKAVAGEAGVPFLFASGSEFIEMVVGVGAKRVRELFTQAKKLAPCIVFIDEIDAIGSRRGSVRSHSENDQTLNQLLCELDGFSTDNRVILLCGTNRFEKLDPALIRPGRLDRKIYLSAPALDGRIDLFDLYLSRISINQDNRMYLAKRLAGLTPGCTGADIASICNEGAIYAAREKKNNVEIQDLEVALDRLLLGNKLQKSFSPTEKRNVAIHESGHACVAWFLRHCYPVLKISIIPRGQALGVNQFLPSEDKLMSKEQLCDMIAAILGGRAAEEILVGSISSGASDDLEKATKIAYQQVCLLGMDKEFGLVSYPSIGRKLSGEGYSGEAEYGPDVANKIDVAVGRIVSAGYERAKSLIVEKREVLLHLADELCNKELLSNEEIEKILGKRPEGSLTVEHILSKSTK